jgi:O-antigen/teichoic acid export membrane protein
MAFAHLHLSQTDIGRFETFIMMSGMVSFFGVSGIINSMLSLYPRKADDEKRELLFNTFVALTLFSLLAAVVLILVSKNLLAFLHKDSGEAIVPLAVIYLLLNNPAFLLEYILFLNDKKKALVAYAVFFGLATLLAAVLPGMLNLPVVYAMAGIILVALVKLVVVLILLRQHAIFKFNGQLLGQSLTLSLPLIASIFVSGSAEYIDGIIVKARFDNVFFSIYRYGAKELPVLLIVANTLSAAMIPAIATNLDAGLKELKEKSAKLMHLFFPLTMALLLVSPYIYRYAFSENFVYSAQIFNIYLLLIVSRVLFPQTILTGLGKNRYLLVSALIEIAINVSLSLYLAGKMGLPGIAIGTFVAYLFDKLFLMAVCFFVFGISPKRYVKVIPYLVYVTLTFVALIGSLLLALNIQS